MAAHHLRAYILPFYFALRIVHIKQVPEIFVQMAVQVKIDIVLRVFLLTAACIPLDGAYHFLLHHTLCPPVKVAKCMYPPSHQKNLMVLFLPLQYRVLHHRLTQIDDLLIDGIIVLYLLIGQQQVSVDSWCRLKAGYRVGNLCHACDKKKYFIPEIKISAKKENLDELLLANPCMIAKTPTNFHAQFLFITILQASHYPQSQLPNQYGACSGSVYFLPAFCCFSHTISGAK
jgi:hypothetical protein